MRGFIFIRDAMWPAGLWDFGLVDGVVPWIRITDNAVLLLALGVGSLVLVAVRPSDKALRALVWWGTPDVSTLLLGVGGALPVVVPIFVVTADQPVVARWSGGDSRLTGASVYDPGGQSARRSAVSRLPARTPGSGDDAGSSSRAVGYVIRCLSRLSSNHGDKCRVAAVSVHAVGGLDLRVFAPVARGSSCSAGPRTCDLPAQ